MGRSRQRERYYGPVVTIAEGRSRRQVKKVDYNFSAYDEQLQEAMDVIDEPTVKTKYENGELKALTTYYRRREKDKDRILLFLKLFISKKIILIMKNWEVN